MFVFSAVALLSLSTAPSAHAWWSIPHMVVIEIARTELSPEAESHVNLNLKAYSRFYPESSLISSSIWADQVQVHGNSFFEQWHFVDIPVALGNVKAPQAPSENIIWALNTSLSLLQSPANDAWGRSLATRLLIHLLADIHQPLHCASLFSSAYRSGDKRGTLLRLQQSVVREARDLHSFWDAGAGYFKNISYTGGPQNLTAGIAVQEPALTSCALQITRKVPKSTFQPGQMDSHDFSLWAKESHAAAVKTAYGGTVGKQLSARRFSGAATLDDAYIIAAQTAVERQLALAGYRLAALLNRIYIHMPNQALIRSDNDIIAGPGSRAAPLLATALGLVGAIAAALLVMLLRERDRRRRGWAEYGEQTRSQEMAQSWAESEPLAMGGGAESNGDVVRFQASDSFESAADRYRTHPSKPYRFDSANRVVKEAHRMKDDDIFFDD